jgi:hypothetical protein
MSGEMQDRVASIFDVPHDILLCCFFSPQGHTRVDASFFKGPFRRASFLVKGRTA